MLTTTWLCRQVVSEPEKHLLVIELCEGGELFDVVASSGGLSEELARDYFRQILLFLLPLPPFLGTDPVHFRLAEVGGSRRK